MLLSKKNVLVNSKLSDAAEKLLEQATVSLKVAGLLM